MERRPLSAKEIRPLLSQLWKKKKSEKASFFYHFSQTFQFYHTQKTKLVNSEFGGGGSGKVAEEVSFRLRPISPRTVQMGQS